MEPSSQHIRKNKRFNFKTVKKVAKIGSVVLFLSIGVSFVVSIYTNNILGKIIQELIKLRTEGTYNVQYEELDFSFLDHVLKVKNLELSVDTTSENFIGIINTGGEIAFSAKVPYMYLDISDVWSIYFDRELKINGVRFDDPVLNIKNYKEEEGIVWQQDAGSLYEIISAHLEVFKINQMEVKDGKFYFEKKKGSPRKYAIKDISFSIKNFLIDSASVKNKKKFFYTDDIDLELENQRIYLKDSVHTLFFKKLMLSTTKSEVAVDSLVVSENKRSSQSKKNQDFYSIYVPSILIQNVDFKSAYNDEVLNIGNLNILFPKINISDFPKEYSGQDSTKSSLAALALGYFSNIAIDSFNLKNASLGYQFKTHTKSQGFKLDSLNMRLTQFKLDSSNIISQRPLYYETLEFSIKDYQFNLPDSIHIFSFAHLVGSTSKRNLTFENMRIRPRSDANLKKLLAKNHKNKTIDIYFPKAVFHNVAGQDFFNTDTLRIDKVEAENPVIELTEYPEFASKNDYSDSLLFDLYPLLKGFTKALYISHGSFTNGNFTWLIKEQKLIPQYMVQNFELKFNNAMLDANSKNHKKLFSAENFDVYSKKTILEGVNDKFSFYSDNLYYSGAGKKLNADDIQLVLKKENPGETPDIFNVRHLQCGGIDLNHIFVEGKSNISFLKIKDPEIIIHRETGTKNDGDPSQSIPPVLKNLDVKQFSIENGNFDISLANNRHFEARNVFFEFDKFLSKKNLQKKFSLKNYELKLSNLVFSDSIKNILSIKKLIYNPQDSSTLLKDLTYRSSKGKKDFQDIKVPEALITQWRPLNLYFHNEISPNVIQLNDPEFVIVKGAEKKNRDLKIGELIDKIDAEKLVIKNGRINYRSPKGNDSLYYKTEKIDLTLHKFVLDSSNSDNVFSLENIETNLANTLVTFHNSSDTIFIGSIAKKETGNSFELKNLIYKSYDKKTGERLFRSEISKAEIDGFDFDKLNDKCIEINKLHIVSPTISYDDRLLSNNSSIRDVVFLQSLNLKKKGLHRIKINSIDLDSGKVDLLLKEKVYSKPLIFKQLGLNISDFDTDKRDKILNARDVKISFEGIEYDLPDSLNLIKTGRITLSLSDSSLIVDGFNWIPKVDKYDYADIKGKQTDFLKINAGQLRFRRMDYDKFLTKEGIVAERFDIDDLDIYAFRDKRIPLKNEVYKPLPQELLRNLKLLINIDTTVVKNGDIIYEEFAVDANKPGLVEFSNLDATAFNISNDSSILKTNPKCYVYANALMMGQGKLSATFRFDMLSPENYFNIDATLDAMDLRYFNSVLEPIAFVSIKKGKNNKLHFTALANDDVAVGSMYFQYEDLKISLINKNTFDTKGMGPLIGSFFANTFIINKNNPRLLILRDGEIYFERDKTKSIFNYWAKLFFSGVVSSIGAKNNKKEIRKYEKMDNDEIREKK